MKWGPIIWILANLGIVGVAYLYRASLSAPVQYLFQTLLYPAIALAYAFWGTTPQRRKSGWIVAAIFAVILPIVAFTKA